MVEAHIVNSSLEDFVLEAAGEGSFQHQLSSVNTRYMLRRSSHTATLPLINE